MRSYFPALALLFIAFTNPSIAQKAEAAVEEVVVVEGEPLTVECSLRVEQRAEWRVDGAAPQEDMRAAGERTAPGDRLRAMLRTAHARPSHAGSYSCFPGATPVRVRVLPAAAGGDPTPVADPPSHGAPTIQEEAVLRDLVYYKMYYPLTFNCSQNTLDKMNYEWFKNGTKIQGLNTNPKGPLLEENGALLTYKRALEDDFGNYTCKINNASSLNWEAKAISLARVPPNTNVVEGQKFSITCKLTGKPYEHVDWLYKSSDDANATLLPLEGRFSTKDSPIGVPEGVLEVTDAKPEDAGIYVCQPKKGEPVESVLRVKDVYAALWPFLGICLEVFILCVVILVYEKRRTKPEMEDSDADTHDQ